MNYMSCLGDPDSKEVHDAIKIFQILREQVKAPSIYNNDVYSTTQIYYYTALSPTGFELAFLHL